MRINTIKLQKEQNTCDSTTPGPFQKYLFSGACYVQIGECYKILTKLLTSDANIDDNRELADNLESIWNNYVTQLPYSAITEILRDIETKPGSDWADMESLFSEISSTGKFFTKDFLSSMNNREAKEISLKQFFIQWAYSCDKAYQQLIYSDAYSKAIAKVADTAIKSPDFIQHD